MARLVRGYAIGALENNALWHERDISHSSAERVILPDATIAVDYMLAKTASLIEKLVVNEKRMLENLNLTRGLVFSGQLLLELAKSGASREDAYRWVQRCAMKSWDEGLDFRTLIANDADIAQALDAGAIDRVFDLEALLKNVDRIFERVFGRSK